MIGLLLSIWLRVHPNPLTSLQLYLTICFFHSLFFSVHFSPNYHDRALAVYLVRVHLNALTLTLTLTLFCVQPGFLIIIMVGLLVYIC